MSNKKANTKKRTKADNPKLAHMTEPWQRLYELIAEKTKK